MIACYPLEPDVPPPPPAPPTPTLSDAVSQPVNTVSNFFQDETSECNYLVLAFIVGVLFIAFTDSMKR